MSLSIMTITPIQARNWFGEYFWPCIRPVLWIFDKADGGAADSDACPTNKVSKRTNIIGANLGLMKGGHLACLMWSFGETRGQLHPMIPA